MNNSCTICRVTECREKLMCDVFARHLSEGKAYIVEDIKNPGWENTHLLAENTAYFTIEELYPETLARARAFEKELNESYDEDEREEESIKELLKSFQCPVWPFKCVNYLHKRMDWQDGSAGLDCGGSGSLGIIEHYMSIMGDSYEELGVISPELSELTEVYRKKTNDALADHLIHAKCTYPDRKTDYEGQFSADSGLRCEREGCPFYDERGDAVFEIYSKMQRFCQSIGDKKKSQRVVIGNEWSHFYLDIEDTSDE